MTEFITRNHGNKDYEIIIKTDNREHYKATEDFARRLIDHAKPQTNADRIRAMSDEELAKMLSGFCILDSPIPFCKNLPECEDLLDTEDGVPEEKCIGCMLNWLQQPAEDK